MPKEPNKRHSLTHVFLLVALAVGCSSEVEAPGPERRVWTAQSVAIDFELLGPVAQKVCTFSATRAELTRDQVEGLSSLALEDGVGGAGCDIYTYHLTVQAADGSSKRFYATRDVCSTIPFLRFEDFDAWARSTTCSMQAVNMR